MIIDLELNDAIYNTLETNSIERGITVKELLRWIIGDYIRFSQPPTPIRIGPPIPVPPDAAVLETTKMIKLSGLFMKSMINQGALKCPNCTQGLTMEDFDEGKCSKCGAEI